MAKFKNKNANPKAAIVNPIDNDEMKKPPIIKRTLIITDETATNQEIIKRITLTICLT